MGICGGSVVRRGVGEKGGGEGFEFVSAQRGVKIVVGWARKRSEVDVI